MASPVVISSLSIKLCDYSSAWEQLGWNVYFPVNSSKRLLIHRLYPLYITRNVDPVLI